MTYTAGRDRGETVVVWVDGKVLAKRGLDPERSFAFSLDVKPRKAGPDVEYESPPVKLSADVLVEPFETRSVVHFTLVAALDETGECLAKSARLRVFTDLHNGPP